MAERPFRDKWAASGLCINCGARPADSDVSVCAYCRERDRASQFARRQRRKAANCCAGCNEPLDTEKVGRRNAARCVACRKAILSRRHKTLYGITPAEVIKLVADQGGNCPVCTEVLDDKAVLDHDHNTNKVRGMLHHGCNTALGKLGDTSESLRRAYEYLLKAGS